MIVILNGAFGVGKTTTARRLVAALPNAMIYDPEIIGFFIKRLNRALPMRGDGTGDYQDIVRWRTLTVASARWLRRCSSRTLIVPMTLAWPAYFQEIVAGLQQIDPDVHHFCLTASLPTIYQRLLDRGDAPGGWTFQQTLRCVESLQTDQYALHIDTEQHDVEQVVELILRRLGR